MMAEAVRRYRETSGSDIVRRLIARPIRLDPWRPAAQPAAVAPDHSVSETATEAAPCEPEHDERAEADFEDEAEDGDVVERLQAEMALMKAVLMAERAESAVLRARIAFEPKPDTLGTETRSIRERSAGMVDRIPLSAR